MNDQKKFFSKTPMPSTTTMVSAVTSAAATAMVLRSIAQALLPYEVRASFVLKLKDFFKRVSNELTLVIEEFDDSSISQNGLFKAAKLYLEPKIPTYVKRIKINLPNKETRISSSVEKNVEIVDIFNGVHLKWKLGTKQVQEQVFASVFHFAHNQNQPVAKSEVRFYELSFHKKSKQVVLGSYIPHVLKKSEEINKEKKTLKLFTLNDRNSLRGDVWRSVNLDHPATFDTMAMDFNVKKMIMDDLERFLKRKDFYRRVGKEWKRGYLLLGPPGTGKSSLIAAMANFLNFDVYNLELSCLLTGNMELKIC